MSTTKDNKNIYLGINSLKMAVFLLIDSVAVFLSYLFGFLVEYDSLNYKIGLFIFCVLFFQIVMFAICGNYKILTSHFGFVDSLRFIFVITGANTIVCLVNKLFLTSIVNLSVVEYILINICECAIILLSRVFKRIVIFYSNNKKDAIPTMIIGAGSGGKVAFEEIYRNESYNNKVVCFVDDNTQKTGKTYLGRPVVGPISELHSIIEKYKIREVVIAIANLDKSKLRGILNQLKDEKVLIKRLPLLTEIDINTKIQIKNVSLPELLGREQIVFDTTQIKEFLQGKTVLITGGGGSIGSELARQCYDFGVSKLILFDIYENAVYNIQQELVRKMKADKKDFKLETLIGSTYNEFRVEEIFKKFKPEIVFHAAAYKHVPLMEDSPAEAIRTNCLGTYNVAKMADKYNTKKMVLVSTDKAVRPTNTMGATKAFAEMIIRFWNNKSKHTSYSAVRFGNVLGSNGSVIPLFKQQIEEGGPVTVTHKEITRFFMTIPEAVSLILQSGVFATGGEIFILDMGKPVKILTLAENVIKQCGYLPYEDIDIVFTGLRPGEKLYEELLIDVSKHEKTSNDKIYVEKCTKVYPMDENIKYISKVFKMTDNDEIKKCLKTIVTSYEDYMVFNAKVKKDAKKY